MRRPASRMVNGMAAVIWVSIKPGAVEVCNNQDDDCNGQIDDSATDAASWYRDSDLDGFGNPNVVEIEPFI